MVLDNLSEEHKVVAVQRLAEMRQFSPEMAQKVALILHRRLESVGDTARRSYSGFKAVADLLNRLNAEESKKILEAIEEDQPELALSIRNLMFTFEDLITVPPATIREIVSGVDKRQLALALRGANEELRAQIFKAMSSRAVEMLKEDMEVLGPVRSREVAQAQQEILNLARRLEAEGKVDSQTGNGRRDAGVREDRERGNREPGQHRNRARRQGWAAQRRKLAQAMTAEGSARDEVEVFEYPACPGAPPLPAWDGWVEAPDEGGCDGASQRTKEHEACCAAGSCDEQASRRDAQVV